MGYCYFCEKEPKENYLGYWCESCRKIKNLGNVYGFDRVLNILTKCCIRDTKQLESKIEIHQKNIEKKENKLGDDNKDYDKPYNLRKKESQYKGST